MTLTAPSTRLHALRAAIVGLCAALVCAACTTAPLPPVAEAPKPAPAPEVKPEPVPAPALPAAPVKAAGNGEAALNEGLKAYQDGQYKAAEAQLKAAIQAGLSQPVDLAKAHKHLAFIYCTSKRETLCGAAFKAAKAADPGFALSKAEAGHPMWSRTYKKALGLK